MAPLPIYSTLFSCIYDEPGPVGMIGRGTHYSVFRSVEWRDVLREPLASAQIHDFAVIWDEDHDTRIMPAIERIYVAGLLSPVQFIGERKGSLTVIVAARFFYHGAESKLESYREAIGRISANLEFDSWTSEVGTFDRQLESPQQTNLLGIIADHQEKVETYLRNVDNLWRLGTRNYSPTKDTLMTDVFEPAPPRLTLPLSFS